MTMADSVCPVCLRRAPSCCASAGGRCTRSVRCLGIVRVYRSRCVLDNLTPNPFPSGKGNRIYKDRGLLLEKTTAKKLLLRVFYWLDVFAVAGGLAYVHCYLVRGAYAR